MILLTKAGERRTIAQDKFNIRLIFPGVKLHNLKDVGLGPLGRVDHATLGPGTVVPMHQHRNDEILSYLRRGRMIHQDTTGQQLTLQPAHLMMMNAGSGIQHEEAVPGDGETVEMLQVFIRPEKEDLEPLVQFHSFEEANSTKGWRLIGGPAGSGAPLAIRSDLQFLDARLENSEVYTPQLNGRTGFLYLFDGSAVVEGKNLKLQKGDALLVREEQLLLRSRDWADLVLFIVQVSAPYTRAGKYSG